MMETVNGKAIQIKPEGYGSLLKISFTTGGQLPKELMGEFTSHTEAKNAITTYLATKEDKAKKAPTTSSKSKD